MSEKNDEARQLAEKHYLLEAGMLRIFRLTAGAEAERNEAEPIKLLEVNESTIPAGIMPIQFGPAPALGVHYSSIILEVTPEEFDKIDSGELPLPAGWKIEEEIPNPSLSNAE